MKQDKAAQAAGAAGASSEAQGATGSEAGQGREGSARGGRGEVPASAEPPSGIDSGGGSRPKRGRGKVPSAIGWAGQGRGLSSSRPSPTPLRRCPAGSTK